MSKEKTTTVFNVVQHVKKDSQTKEQDVDQARTSQEKVAVAIGRQLLKRKLITFETEGTPGSNAGERRITIKGSVVVMNPETE